MKPDDYTVVIETLPNEEGGGYLAIVPDLPGCMSDGPTREAALRSVEDAICAWIEEALATAREVPPATRHPELAA